MKRILYDVPLWHLMLHRENRGMPVRPKPGDPKTLLFEDEFFEVLYTGEGSPVAEKDVNPALGPWATRLHAACQALPQFKRLAADCFGDDTAAAIAVETLMDELDLPEKNDLPPQTAAGSPKDPLRRPIVQACAAASKEVEAYREAAEGLEGLALAPAPGNGGPTEKRTDVGRAKPLAAVLRDNAKLRRIASLAGRFKRIAAAKRRQRVRHGADEITDIEQGSDLARLLPAELAKLRHPQLRMLFRRGLIERQLLQYQLVGTDTLTEGPVVVLLDKSSSMDSGDRDVWAAATAIALLDHASKQNRPFALVTFTGRIVGESYVPAGGTLPIEALMVPSEGSTDISRAVSHGLDVISRGTAPFKKADIVLITDGGSDSTEGDALRARAKALQATIFGIAIGMEPDVLSPWCDDYKGATTLSTLDPDIAASLFAA